MVLEDIGEIGREVGVDGDGLGNVGIDLADEGNVSGEVLGELGLVIVVHLRDQGPVLI